MVGGRSTLHSQISYSNSDNTRNGGPGVSGGLLEQDSELYSTSNLRDTLFEIKGASTDRFLPENRTYGNVLFKIGSKGSAIRQRAASQSEAGSSTQDSPIGDEELLKASLPTEKKEELEFQYTMTSLEKALWVVVGVSEDRDVSHGEVILNELGSAVEGEALDINSSGNTISLKRSAQSYANPGGLPGFDSLAKALKHNNNDWRRPGLKVTLYESLRERVYTSPTGLDWVTGVKGSGNRGYYDMSIADNWNYQITAISPRIASFAINAGYLEVGDEHWPVEGGGTVWLWMLNNEFNTTEMGCR
ncbi:Uncharacterised protein g6551 [Pycnogonum litorale]